MEATGGDMVDQDTAEDLEDREGAAEHDALKRMNSMLGCQDGQHSYDILARALRGLCVKSFDFIGIRILATIMILQHERSRHRQSQNQ